MTVYEDYIRNSFLAGRKKHTKSNSIIKWMSKYIKIHFSSQIYSDNECHLCGWYEIYEVKEHTKILHEFKSNTKLLSSCSSIHTVWFGRQSVLNKVVYLFPIFFFIVVYVVFKFNLHDRCAVYYKHIYTYII